MKRIRRISGFIASVVLGLGCVGLMPVAKAADAPAAAIVRDGKSPETAAGSCWDIKKKNPNSADGAYWLLTPDMSAPEQFFCDQTTDGGGWVLIGKGRDGWDRYPDGQRNPANLLTRSRTPEDFPVTQLSTEKIDKLLAGTAVNKLSNGMRIVRATNSSGTKWQTMNLIPERMTTWSWSLASDHRPTFRFGNSGSWYQTRSMDQRFGLDSGWQSLDLTESRERKYNLGFAFGSSASGGSTNATDFLWSATGNMPLPYTEVYLRPEISSEDPRFERIADEGMAASQEQPMASNFASPTTWGVTGNLNGRTSEGNSPAQAFAEIGDTIYVAGNFTNAEERRSGTVVPRTGVAAFDKTTGELRTQFKVDLDNQAKALLAMPNGKLLIGGDFRTANGKPHSGTVLVDPITGAVDPTWNMQIINRLSGGVVSVKSLALGGNHVYVGGNFTHFTTDNKVFDYARAAGRLNLNGTADRSWNPEFNGTVVDVDTDETGSRFYAAGYFTTSGKTTVKKAAVIDTAPGAKVDTSLNFKGSYFNEAETYQQAVDESGGLLFFGGAQHSLFGYDTSSLQRVSGSVTKTRGGDIQAIASDGQVTYAGCHCSQNTYENAYTFPNLNPEWTRSDNIQWVGAWDTATGKQLGRFSPYKLKSNNAGAWGLFVASDGALWAGGDFTGSYTSIDSLQWNGGFVRFPAKDVTPPAAPTNLVSAGTTEESVGLSWTAAENAASYEILRDDRVIATVTTPNARVAHGGENRFFVRAVDKAGNYSATTPVIVAPTSQEAAKNPTVLIAPNAQWQYSYNNGVPDEKWNQPGATRAKWSEGNAPIGYGASEYQTKITPPAASRPITTWFAKDFEVSDPKAFTTATLNFVADDGAVVYVNGKEAGRVRMSEGTVTADTRANAAVTAQFALANRQTLNIPSSLLKEGTNTIGVETHLNYRTSPTMGFDGSLMITDTNPAPEQPVDAPQPPADEKAEKPADEKAEAPADEKAELLGADTMWQYWSEDAAPDNGWDTTADLGDWNKGVGPLGWGDAGVITEIAQKGDLRPITTYFAHDLTIDKAQMPADAVVEFKVRADDAALLRLNGEEVGRMGLDEGTVDNQTYANHTVETPLAVADPLIVRIPVSKFKDGVNRIGVESHLNDRKSPSVTFDLSAVVAQ